MAILTNYEAPKAVNPFAKDIEALAEAGEGAAYELIAQTEKTEGVRGTIKSKRAQFQDAAREAGHSARVVENDEREDGTTRLVFILGPKRTRSPKATVDSGEISAKGRK